MTRPMRIAFFGCGGIAGNIAMIAQRNDDIEIVACCDKDDDRAAAFAEKVGIPRPCTDYREMAASVEADAAYIALPHFLHRDAVEVALAAGWHILLEKPIAHTLEDALAILALAENVPQKVGVNFQNRYDPALYALAQAARRGDLGEIHYARVNVPWQRGENYLYGWHGIRAQSGGGALITQGIHFLDLVLWASDQPPVSAIGMTAQRKYPAFEVEDLAMGTVELANGALVSIASGMIASSEQAITIEIYGARGTGIYTNRPEPTTHFRDVKIDLPQPPVTGVHPLQCSMEGFRRWVMKDDDSFLMPIADTLPVTLAVDAIYRAAATGQRVEIAPALVG